MSALFSFAADQFAHQRGCPRGCNSRGQRPLAEQQTPSEKTSRQKHLAGMLWNQCARSRCSSSSPALQRFLSQTHHASYTPLHHPGRYGGCTSTPAFQWCLATWSNKQMFSVNTLESMSLSTSHSEAAQAELWQSYCGINARLWTCSRS